MEAASGESGPKHFSLLDLAFAIVAGATAMVLAAVVYFVVLLTGGLPLSGLRAVVQSPLYLGHYAVIASLTAYATIFLFLLWRGARRGIAARDMGFALPAGKWLAIAVIAIVALRIISGASHFGLSDTDVDRSVEIAKSMFPGGVVWNAATVVMIVVFAPLAEELFFRVVLYSSLTRYLPRLAAALIVVAVFAALHMQYSTLGGRLALVLTGDIALLGAALMWLYVRSGSIWPSVLLHALNNGLTLAALLAFTS